MRGKDLRIAAAERLVLMRHDIAGLEDPAVPRGVAVRRQHHAIAALDRAAHRRVDAIFALHAADDGRVDAGAAAMLDGHVVAGAGRELRVEGEAGLAGMEGIAGPAVMLHEEDGHAGLAGARDEARDALDRAFAVMEAETRDLEHALLHIDDHERRRHRRTSNASTGVQLRLRRVMRAGTSSASKSCGVAGKSSAGRSLNVLTFTVNQPRPSSSSSAPI